MIPDNYLYLHTFHNYHGSNLTRALENLLCCAENTPMRFFQKILLLVMI